MGSAMEAGSEVSAESQNRRRPAARCDVLRQFQGCDVTLCVIWMGWCHPAMTSDCCGSPVKGGPCWDR